MDGKSARAWTHDELVSLIREVVARDQEQESERLVARLQELSRLGVKVGSPGLFFCDM